VNPAASACEDIPKAYPAQLPSEASEFEVTQESLLASSRSEEFDSESSESWAWCSINLHFLYARLRAFFLSRRFLNARLHEELEEFGLRAVLILNFLLGIGDET
jgi:hypothetical protein